MEWSSNDHDEEREDVKKINFLGDMSPIRTKKYPLKYKKGTGGGGKSIGDMSPK